MKTVGAKGRQEVLSQTDVLASFDQGEQIELADLANRYTDTAIKTLVEVMKSEDSPANAKVSAATRILEFAHGKANQAPAPVEATAGLTINILRLSDGQNRSEVMDAVDVAREMIDAGVIASDTVSSKDKQP